MAHALSENDLEAQTRMIAALRSGRGFQESFDDVILFETHISWVLLAGDYAYKIKKSLDVGFLDFTSLARRRHFCNEEVRLNSRMAKPIYVDVVPIGGTPDAPLVGAEPAIEYAVRMRRFSTEAEMDKLIETGKLTPAHVDSLAHILARFHMGLTGKVPDTHYGSAAAVHTLMQQNFSQIPDDFLNATGQFMVAAMNDATEDEFQAHEALIERRRQKGFVRECHGDLHLGNILVMHEAAMPFDGIEFDPGLRWIDIISDIAFPLMDFLYYGRSDLAYRLLNGWLEVTGDYDGLQLLPLYASYRAAVRAKVSAIRAAQPGIRHENQLRAQEAFYKYLSIACSCLARPRPALIITHGLPGSGKTTFSQAALERFGAIRMRSDVERKRLFGLAANASSQSAIGENIYTSSATAQTYQALLDMAQQVLKSGYRVIIDAAFLKTAEREQFRQLAHAMRVPFVIASIQAPEAALRDRIEERMKQGRDASEADLNVLDALQSSHQPLTEHEQTEAIVFHNDGVNGFPASDPGWQALGQLLE